MNGSIVLTTHLGARSECCCHIGIHGDVDVLALLYSLIAFLYSIAHPPAEDALKECGSHITYPLLAHLVDFLGVRHVLPYFLVAVIEKGGYMLQGESLILRHLDMTHIFRLDTYGQRE